MYPNADHNPLSELKASQNYSSQVYLVRISNLTDTIEDFEVFHHFSEPLLFLVL